MPAWEHVTCDVCGGRGQPVFDLPHPDAPGGFSQVLACPGCDLKYLSPRPAYEAMSRYYTDDSNAFVGRRRSIWKQVGWNLLRDLRIPYFDVNPRPVGEVLDVGCGYGDILLYLQTRGARCIGVDADARAVARAREYGLDVRLGRLEQQRFSTASFDTVVLCHSLEHMHAPRALLAEVRRVVKPHGIVHIAVPSADSPAFGPAWRHLSFPLHLFHFTPASLEHCVRSVDLVPVCSATRREIIRMQCRRA